MDHHRPSILHRPLRNGSLATKETREEQFQREQEALRRRAAVQQEHMNRLTATLYPTEETKAAAAAEAQRQLQAHQAAKLQAQMMERKMEEEQERAWAQHSSSKVPSPTSGQPVWSTASMYYSSDFDERAARRRYEEEVFAANMMAARQRAYEQQRQKAEEEEAARRLLAEESNFWNLGVRSERWLPPERRLHSPRSPKEPLSAEPHPPVWTWASDQVARNYVPPRTGGLDCRSSPDKPNPARPKTPWALDEELDAAARTKQQQQLQQQQSLQQVQQRYQCRPASASYTGAKAVPWATDLDPPSTAAPAHAPGRRHLQYLPQQRDPDAFGARVDRGIPFS
ncbi:hypothetical protein DUNSADRAFT_12180 [Dunaliella salina]|uniref:Uncharacterized protein n=1 Tax=Dunaliella salina TaxID=3046 RepID=A0ABQ7GBT8_DUNSA|nr:hypothetical protein DUNSADRAFT_12180 [Dunaliella salina]|eukprot:KAF5832067.1 hypothetical protein DUNSADRAFT_12180 [Dunaliella salina]